MINSNQQHNDQLLWILIYYPEKHLWLKHFKLCYLIDFQVILMEAWDEFIFHFSYHFQF